MAGGIWTQNCICAGAGCKRPPAPLPAHGKDDLWLTLRPSLGAPANQRSEKRRLPRRSGICREGGPDAPSYGPTSRELRSLHGRLSAVAVSVLIAVLASSVAGASHGEMRRAGERYAAAAVDGALKILGSIIRRGGRTAWQAEALLLRAAIREHDLGRTNEALRDLRTRTVRFASRAASAAGQFRIASIYHRRGFLADAYREYVLCSRLRGFPPRPGEREPWPPGPEGAPVPRITRARARALVDLAARRAAKLFNRIPDAAAGEAGLPPRTFVMLEGLPLFRIPADRAGASASGERTSTWYAVAPAGKSVESVSVEFAAAVDGASGGPRASKRYRLAVAPLPLRPPAGRAGRGSTLVLSGVSTRPEKLTGALHVPGGAPAVRFTLHRTGARVLGLEVRVTLRDRPPEPVRPPAPPTGFALAGPSRVSSAGTFDKLRAGGVSLARRSSAPDSQSGAPTRPAGRGENAYFLAFHSPALCPRGSTANEDADLFLATSADGRTWEAPRRLPVSSALDDRDPAVAVARDGRLVLAWASARRGEGTSDIYVATSEDGREWSAPSRLDVGADLESMRGGVNPMTGRARGGLHVELAGPEVSVDSAGRVSVFFVARGFERRERDPREPVRPKATGVYGVVSTDLKKWSKPVAIVSTPQIHLNSYRPAPKSIAPEVVSHLARPSVMERRPGRRPGDSIVAWLSSCGRVFLSVRDAAGPARIGAGRLIGRANAPRRGGHTDTRLAGAKPSLAACAVRLLGPLDDGAYGVLVIRRDVGARVFWRNRKSATGWDACDLDGVTARTKNDEARMKNEDVDVLNLQSSIFFLSSPADGRRWLTAWTAAPGEGTGASGVYTRIVSAPEKKP